MKIQYLLSLISIFSTVLSGNRTSLTMKKQLMLVKVHNEKRSIVQPTASNMQKMRFSQDLADSAQDWADKCTFGYGRVNMERRKFKQVGQNIAVYPDEPFLKRSVDSWDREKNNYGYFTGNCSKDQCGNFTQVVWANSYLVGCGARHCPNMTKGLDWNYLVCHYYAAGNRIRRKPYKSGASCSACPSKAPKCVSNLCVLEDLVGEGDDSVIVSEAQCPKSNQDEDGNCLRPNAEGGGTIGNGGRGDDGSAKIWGFKLWWIIPILLLAFLLGLLALLCFRKKGKKRRRKHRGRRTRW